MKNRKTWWGRQEEWDGMRRTEYDVPPMIPIMYPIPEYRPSTPQSDAQPVMVDAVKTYTRPFFRETQIRAEEDRKRGVCVCVYVGRERVGPRRKIERTGMTDESSPDSLHDRY